VETLNNQLAIMPVTIGRVESEVVGGFAVNRTRSSLIASTLVFSYRLSSGRLLLPGTKVYLDGLAGAEPWSKKVLLTPEGQPFVLAPESRIIAVGSEGK
jgi:hypothetical protein